MINSPLAKTALVLLLALGSSEARADLQTISPRELWPEATDAMRSGDLKRAQAHVDDLLAAGRLLDIQRFPVFAESAASFALQAQEHKDRKLADWAMVVAHRLDPQSPDVEFAAADLALQRSEWPRYFSSIGTGVAMTFTNYRARVLAMSDLTLTLCAAVAATTILFGLLLFYRYASAAGHDFREMFGVRFSANTALVLGWAALFAPLFLWLGPTWVLLYWFALFFAYATPRERVLIVLSVLAAGALPVVTAWAAYRISGIDSPVIQAAVAQKEKSFTPEALRRLRELQDVLPEEPVIAMLMGNLEVQEANERAAAQHYRRAIELDDKLAGAHLNLGNLYFFENDNKTARLEYKKAAALDPGMAIAHYNHSVASGEGYDFGEQGDQIEMAKQKDRVLIQYLLQHPPAQKVVMHELPLSQAWGLAERIARGGEASEIYGNHAVFDLVRAMQTPLTAGSMLALVAIAALWYARRKNGAAASCIKCGRTFCYRCKPSGDSAKYCTHCVHIYLKRDGVSIETKREKLQEVQDYQARINRRAKFLTTFIPGSGQIVNDSTIRGFIALLLFTVLVSLALFIGNLAPIAAPALGMKTAVRIAATTLAALVWLFASVSVYREKVAG